VDPLANVVWEALTTNHAGFADGDGPARRYQPEVAVFAGMTDDSPASWAALGELVGAGHAAVLFRETQVEAPSGWSVVFAGQGHQMVLTAPLAPASGPDVVELGDDDAPEMRALVELTKPGPFGRRTHELGGYVGIRDPGDGRLLAMAGRRTSVPGYTEVSAVCTHPDARRRGYGEVVTTAVSRRLLDEGITPFLHVAVDNHNARRVYERLGFTTRRIAHFVAVRAPAAPASAPVW
jgi:ribosomal protein S18 acetylase RimI-like enzyme